MQQVVTRAYGTLQKLQAEPGPVAGETPQEEAQEASVGYPTGRPGAGRQGGRAMCCRIVTMGFWLWTSRWRHGRGTGCPMLEPVRERARGSGEPCSVISVTQSDVNPAELALGEEEQRLERRDRDAMDQAQAKFEEEESQYYQEAERAVQEHIQSQEAQRYQAWEDWAMFDEMRGGNGAGRGRKRLFLEVTVGPRGGEAGPE